MLTVLNIDIHTHNPKGHRETLGDNGYIYYHNRGVGMVGMCICPNI